MSDKMFASLEGLRIGCVRYLNARPLIEPYERAGGAVTLEHPSSLAAMLSRGELDAALVPAFEAIRSPGFPIVDGVSIAACGPVLSVFVAYQGELSDIREIALDPASLTSANLCKVIFAEWGAEVPCYLPEPAPPGAARLLIGNQALDFREQHGDAFNYLDFGAEWLARTGLPFVFAVWLLRPEVRQPERVAEAFREIARQGAAMTAEIAAAHFDPDFALRYLTEAIRFGLGDAEKAGLGLYKKLLLKHHQVPPEIEKNPFTFV